MSFSLCCDLFKYSYKFIRYGQKCYYFNVIFTGQKSRVAFAVLCAKEPNFIVLDEPTNHLDMETIEALANGEKLVS